MATIAAQISSTGILAPDYSNILQQLKIVYWSIYGSDAILDNDSQDGQFLAVLAQAIFDCNQTTINVYNAFSPATARGVQLSSLVKLNGLRRATATNSEVIVTLTGDVGTQIIEGIVGDNLSLGTRWFLPTLVIIPISGEVAVTATAEFAGDIAATIGSITEILTPTLGWQTVTNEGAAVLGQPIETDSELRLRQSKSTALPAMTVLEGIYAAVSAVNGVERLMIYENSEDVADVNGIPPHSICVVMSGGDVTEIAEAIALKKSPGVGTYGTTLVVVEDRNGVPNNIRLYELTKVPLRVRVDIHPLAGYVSTTGDLLKQAVVDFINGLEIGEDSYLARLYTPANTGGVGLGATYVVLAITQAKDNGDPLLAADIPITFQQGTTLSLDDVILVLA